MATVSTAVNRFLAEGISKTDHMVGRTGIQQHRIAQRFTGQGRYVQGIRWYFHATSGGMTTSDKYVVSLRRDTATNNSPDTTILTGVGGKPVSTARTLTVASSNSWITATFQDYFYCTAGTKYWIHFSMQTYSGSKKFYPRAVGGNKNYWSPFLSTSDINQVCKKRTTSGEDVDGWSEITAGIGGNASTPMGLAMYVVGTSPGTYKQGIPYHTAAVQSWRYNTAIGATFRTDALTVSTVSIYLHTAGTNSKRLSIYSGTAPANFSGLQWSTVVNHDVKGWKTYTVNQNLSAGWYRLVCTSSGHDNSDQSIVNLGDPLLPTHTYESTTYHAFASTGYHLSRDFPLYIRFRGGITYITLSGYVREWSKNTVFPGVKIRYYENNTILASVKTNNSGYWVYTSANSAGDIKVEPQHYYWDFDPVVKKWNNQVSNTAANFTLGPDTIWHNVASVYAFRSPILFKATHPRILKDRLIKVPIKTGEQRTIAINGDRGESIQHSGAQHIAYWNNKTHVVWRAQGGATWGSSLDHNTNLWSAPRKLNESRHLSDSHYYPSIIVDNSGYIHMIEGGHDDGARYTRLATANEMSKPVNTAEPNISGTYPRMRLTNNNCLMIFFRRLEPNSVADASDFAYDIKPYVSTSSWVITPLNSFRRSIIYATSYSTNAMSVYCGGFQVDNNNYLHAVFNVNHDYGLTNIASHLYYMYSPPSLDTAYNITRPGLYWYAANGSPVAIITGNTTQPMRAFKATSNAALVATSFNNMGNAHNRNLHTNTEGLFLHPYDTFYNGRHTIPQAYFTCHEWGNYVSEECIPYLCWYSTTASNRNAHNWVMRNLATALVTYGYSSSVRAYKGRHYGGIVIDKNRTFHIFGSYKVKYNESSAWWGGELIEWYSTNPNKRWDKRNITDRSGEGVPMNNPKKDYSNNQLELVYCRGRNIEYYSEDLQYSRFRDDGKDAMIMYTGTGGAANKLDFVANMWNHSSTNIYFKLSTSIPKNWKYSTAGQFYVYYGKINNSTPLSDPENVFELYENFENYTVHAPVTSLGKWLWKSSTRTGAQTASSNCIVIWSVNSHSDPAISALEHTNKIWSGDKSAYIARTSGSFSTAYFYTVLPTALENNFKAEISIWDVTGTHSFFGMTYGNTHTIVGVKYGGSGDIGWYYHSGKSWIYSPIQSPIGPQGQAMFRFTMAMSTAHVYFYVNDGATALNPAIEIPTRAAKRIIWGITPYLGGLTAKAFYDHFTLSKAQFDYGTN